MKKMIDRQFQQMARALDVSQMQKSLQKHLFSSSDKHKNALVIQCCQIEEQRYKPKKSCVITYNLEILNAEKGGIQEQIVCARLCKAGEGLFEWEQAKSSNLFPIEGIFPLVYLPDLEILVWSFPNDRKLSHLPQMLDPLFLHDLFPQRLISLDLRKSKRLLKIETHIVHYLPERSCMIRYDLAVEDRASGESSSLTIYGKVFSDESGHEILSIIRQLSIQLAPEQTAKPIGYDPEFKVLWQSKVPGVPIVAEVIKDPSSLKTMAAIARTVAAFHGTIVKSSHSFKLEEVTRLLRKTVDVVAESHPHLTDRVRFLVSILLAQSEEAGLFSSPTTPIHRDLKLGNMLMYKGNVGLIDMDCVCLGDPLSDIGSFIANFYLNGIYVGCDESYIRERVELFCRTYARKVKWKVPQKALYWYIAASFIYEIVRRSIRQWDKRRLKRLDQFLDLSEHYCFHRA